MRPFLLVSNRYTIKKVYLDNSGSNSEDLVCNLTHSVAVDFDYKEGMVYWSDVQSQGSTINRISIDTKDCVKDEEVIKLPLFASLVKPLLRN